MDSLTREFYNRNSLELQKKYSSSNPDYMKLFNRLKKDARVLDIGSGSGRDLNRLLQLGIDAYGIEPSREFIRSSVNSFPILKGRIEEGSLPFSIPERFKSKDWDLIIIMALFQHIEERDLKSVFKTLSWLIKDGGELLLSIPTKYPGVVNMRDMSKRLFIIRPREEYVRNLLKEGFHIKNEFKSEDSLKREGIEWLTLLFKKN